MTTQGLVNVLSHRIEQRKLVREACEYRYGLDVGTLLYLALFEPYDDVLSALESAVSRSILPDLYRQEIRDLLAARAASEI